MIHNPCICIFLGDNNRNRILLQTLYLRMLRNMHVSLPLVIEDLLVLCILTVLLNEQ